MPTKANKILKSPIISALGFICLAVFLCSFLIAAKPIAQQTSSSDDVETCADCHEDLAKAFMTKPHSVSKDCTSCHGDAEKHLEEGGGPNIFAFKASDFPTQKTEKCLNCHKKSNARYFSSPHGKAALDCTTCHGVHAEKTKPNLLRTSSTKSCLSCHEGVFAQFQMNERHRLQEGIMSCATCHDPHEPAARERLGGFKHESCLKCHTDKGGPYLFEHGASRIEGCTACHDVHGSPNRHMLTQQSISDLCFSCHVTAVSWHSRFDSTSTNCTACHSTIHGSNLSKIFIK